MGYCRTLASCAFPARENAAADHWCPAHSTWLQWLKEWMAGFQGAGREVWPHLLAAHQTLEGQCHTTRKMWSRNRAPSRRQPVPAKMWGRHKIEHKLARCVEGSRHNSRAFRYTPQFIHLFASSNPLAPKHGGIPASLESAHLLRSDARVGCQMIQVVGQLCHAALCQIIARQLAIEWNLVWPGIHKVPPVFSGQHSSQRLDRANVVCRNFNPSIPCISISCPSTQEQR